MSRADDWVAILEVKAAYGWHYDSPDAEALIDLFTDDAVCVFGPYGSWNGKGEIEAGFAENVSAPDNNFPTLHATTNPMITVDGNTAKGKFFLLDNVLTREPAETTNGVFGVYFDEFRKEDGQWRISRSELQFLWNSEQGRMAPGEARKLDWHPDA